MLVNPVGNGDCHKAWRATPTPQAGAWEDLVVDPLGAWSPLETGVGQGLVDRSVYDEVCIQRQANKTGTTAYPTGTGEAVEPNTKDAWFWSPLWQAGEEEVDAALARGESATFDSAEEFLADLGKLDRQAEVTQGPGDSQGRATTDLIAGTAPNSFET